MSTTTGNNSNDTSRILLWRLGPLKYAQYESALRAEMPLKPFHRLFLADQNERNFLFLEDSRVSVEDIQAIATAIKKRTLTAMAAISILQLTVICVTPLRDDEPDREKKWGIDPDQIASKCQTHLCSLVMTDAALTRNAFGCVLAVLKPFFCETK